MNGVFPVGDRERIESNILIAEGSDGCFRCLRVLRLIDFRSLACWFWFPRLVGFRGLDFRGLNAQAGAAHVTKRLMCNYLEYAAGRN